VSETWSVDPRAVFVNAPFDSAYEPLFVTLIGMVAFLDYDAHCVLEVRETGEGRLQRIYDLMRTCRISIHDMSRIGAPVRFNMPFELGLAVSLKLAAPQQYEVIVLDSQAHRMDRRLSDFKGRDLFIHDGTCDGMIEALLDAFQSQRSDASELRRAARALRTYARNTKRVFRAKTIFHPHLFSLLTKAAVNIATERGFLLP
jgi:hypothetical protein